MHGIEAQQMRVGLDWAEVVDGDDLDVVAIGLVNGPQHVAADAAKSVDRDSDCHSISPQRFENLSRLRRLWPRLKPVSCPE